MTELQTGYDPATDEYTVEGALRALGGISRATLDRWVPAGTDGRRRLDTPGVAGQVRIAGSLIRALLPLPAGEGQASGE